MNILEEIDEYVRHKRRVIHTFKRLPKWPSTFPVIYVDPNDDAHTFLSEQPPLKSYKNVSEDSCGILCEMTRFKFVGGSMTVLAIQREVFHFYHRPQGG